jgi:GNAT superfamily N-acetyltransferase
VEVSRVRGGDLSAVDTLAEIDVWNTSRADLLGRLEEGQQCYVAKHEGQIVSSGWWQEGSFRLPSLERRFNLAAGEIYVHCAQTIPAFRGKGIYPYLRAESLRDLSRTQGKTRALAFIRAANKPSLRAWDKMGGRKVGRVGFVEVLGLRFHYLLARNVLWDTPKRFFVERM